MTVMQVETGQLRYQSPRLLLMPIQMGSLSLSRGADVINPGEDSD